MGKNTVTHVICVMSAVTMILTKPLAVWADVYPGDTAYSRIVQNVYRGVTSDNIRMGWKSDIRTRPQLCQTLVRRHNDRAPARNITNASFIGATITVGECLDALYQVLQDGKLGRVEIEEPGSTKMVKRLPTRRLGKIL